MNKNMNKTDKRTIFLPIVFTISKILLFAFSDHKINHVNPYYVENFLNNIISKKIKNSIFKYL